MKKTTVSSMRDASRRIVQQTPVLAAALALVATNAAATDGRYREFVIGERAGGMGGAAIAVATDVDAVFYNPAGLVRSQSDSISLSANLYGIEHYKTKGALDWGADDTSDSFVTIPGAMGGVRRVSDTLVYGFGVFAPKQEKRHVIASDSSHTSFSHGDYNDQTLWIGPAVGWTSANSPLSFGAGLFAVYRDSSISQSAFQSGSYSMNGAIDLKTLGVLASFGAQLDLGDGWYAGATIQTPNLRVWDDGTLSVNAFSQGYYDFDGDAGVYSTDVKANNYIPWQLALGVGRTVPGKWGFAFDAVYHPSASYNLMRWNINGVRLNERVHLHSVLDVSIGGEYIFAEHYPVRFGVYTAFSSTEVPNDPDSTNFITSDVDMYGVTLSVGHRSDNMCVNFGLNFAFGSGHDLTTDDVGDSSRSDCDRCILLATASTTYYF